MNELEQAFKLIKASTDADFHGPQTESLIAKAETALGLHFPPTYRRFVKTFGCGLIPGCEIFGLVNDDFENSGIPDAIWLTLDERRTANAPQSLIFVSDTGDGGYYAIDVSLKTPDGESPVVEWWPGAEGVVGNGRIIASDFGAFLLQQVQEAAQL